MSAEQVIIRDVDLRMVDIYKDFLPKQVFDAHIHLYLSETIPAFRGPEGTFFLDAATPEDYIANMQPLFPGVEQFRLNMMPMPDRILNDLSNGTRDRANGYIAEQIARCPNHVGSAYILATDTEQMIGDMLSVPGMRALKPYCYGANITPATNLEIGQFLPEAAWVVANQTGTPIVLHMMRSRSLADPANLAYINEMTKRYPNVPLILAHCARGFASWTAVTQIRNLIDHDNIWFDMAAVCEVGPMMASIQKNMAKRVMWGTDWPICLKRGRAVSMADNQQWFSEAHNEKTGYALLASESVLAFYQTAILLDLDQTQVDDIFYNNAAGLFLKQ